MPRSTLTAIPRRVAVLAAKAVNLAGLTLTAGLIAVSRCLTAARLMLPGAGLGPARLPTRFPCPRRHAACSRQREGWLGEVKGLRVSLAGADDKLAQLDRRPTPVNLGMPAAPANPD